jgi:hypothetical protein
MNSTVAQNDNFFGEIKASPSKFRPIPLKLFPLKSLFNHQQYNKLSDLSYSRKCALVNGENSFITSIGAVIGFLINLSR